MSNPVPRILVHQINVFVPFYDDVITGEAVKGGIKQQPYEQKKTHGAKPRKRKALQGGVGHLVPGIDGKLQSQMSRPQHGGSLERSILELIL